MCSTASSFERLQTNCCGSPLQFLGPDALGLGTLRKWTCPEGEPSPGSVNLVLRENHSPGVNPALGVRQIKRKAGQTMCLACFSGHLRKIECTNFTEKSDEGQTDDEKWSFQAQVPICGWLMAIPWCVTLSGCRGWLLKCSYYFLYGNIGLFWYTLPMDQLFNLEFQFESAFNLEFQPKFGI